MLRTKRAPLLLLLLLAGGLGLAGCSTVGMRYERLIGAPALPPTSPANVEILRHAPRRPHVKLGHVVLEPSGEPDVHEMEQKIREGAAAMGADAAVLVRDTTRRIGVVYEGPWWARSAYPVYGRVVVAVAIRYQEQPAAP